MDEPTKPAPVIRGAQKKIARAVILWLYRNNYSVADHLGRPVKEGDLLEAYITSQHPEQREGEFRA